MFKNKEINEIHATRYIASWVRSGGGLYYGADIDKFSEWLSSLGLTDEDVAYIRTLATCGKMELEHSVKEFLAK